MKTYTPNYYKKFKCIADKCEHSCCIGWEIDIDEDTLDFYEAIEGKKLRYIKDSISYEGTPHFEMLKGDRCPHLLENGLCRIICDFDEGALCDICADHPRFRNFYENFTEEGLGLCCEEAARIILTEEETFCINVDISKAEPEEKRFFSLRSMVLDILQDRQKMVKERFLALAQEFGLEFSFTLSDLCQEFLALERLDSSWTDILEELKNYSFDEKIFENDLQLPLEQLACYFVFRHLADAQEDENYAQVIKFILKSCYLLGALWQKGEDMINSARMFSSEVEYSEENIEKVIKEVY